jgi:hypothetical protein
MLKAAGEKKIQSKVVENGKRFDGRLKYLKNIFVNTPQLNKKIIYVFP